MNIRYPIYEGVYRILTLLLYKLKRKARPQKFKETGKEINISNLDINRVLTKKEHNEIRRGIQHT